MTRAVGVLLAGAALAGCGGGPAPTQATQPPPAPIRPEVPTPPPPGTPPVSRTAYVGALDRYCATTVRAVERLSADATDPGDPIQPVATFARSYRAGLERLARRTPPAALRQLHLLTLAQGRESADRLDDGVRLGRDGDIDAATTALGEVPGLLPELPRAVRRGAPACDQELGS